MQCKKMKWPGEISRFDIENDTDDLSFFVI